MNLLDKIRDFLNYLFDQKDIVIETLFIVLIVSFFAALASAKIFSPTKTQSPPQPQSFALLVSTNLTRRPCPCGFCNPTANIAVPEHINAIRFDLTYTVSTQLLPIVSLPLKP